MDSVANGHLLPTAKIDDVDPDLCKWQRLYNAFATSHNRLGHRRNILAFVRFAMKPERYTHEPERFETLRAKVNAALSFAGLAVMASGELVPTESVTTLAEAARRAQELRADLAARHTHPDVLACCRAELVADNYFHAVLEAAKSIAVKLRARTGLLSDGAALVDAALSGDSPALRISRFATESERSEQRGFATLVKGVFGMFRNPTAHEAKVLWQMDKADAEDLLSMASLIHRRLDAATACHGGPQS